MTSPMASEEEIVYSGAGGGGKGGGGGGGGGGKGKGGGGSARKPEEDPESLRSRSEASFVAVLSEGEIQGFEDGVDPLTRIFLDGVPLKNRDGSSNFSIAGFFTGSSSNAQGKGGLISAISSSIPGLIRNESSGGVNTIVADYRVGVQNQDPMPGFDDVRAEQGVNIKLTKAAGRVFRVTTSSLFNRLRVRIGIGSLFYVNKDNGDVKGGFVSFNIQIQADGGGIIVNDNKVIGGKSRGPVDFEYEYSLSGNGPWIVSVERTLADPVSTTESNDLYFKAIVGIINQSFRYPNTALLGLKIGAENFSSVPTVAADMLGVKIKIPQNYNPIARTYSGIWNGTFKTEWSNNPVWVFYDLLTNTRYGAGQFIAESQVDRYSLLPIAQYCDELVSDGKGGLEPRFTFNAYITDRGEAYSVLNSLAAAFRGMLYFAEGSVVAIQDAPKSISKIFSPANVIQEVDDNGNVTSPPFSYEGTARKARKTVALVSWNDPDDMYKSKIEYVEDSEGIDRYGYHEVEVRAFGTTSQGQAQRIGRWILLTDQLDVETVTFKTGTEGFFVLPGEVIGIADPIKGGKRYGGRIVSATTSAVTIDSPFTLLTNKSYTLTVMLPNGSLESRTVLNSPGAATALSVNPALSTAPIAGAPWVLQENSDGIRKFRVISINENQGEVTLIASLYNEDKFAIADKPQLSSKRVSFSRLQILPLISSGSIKLGTVS
jgi:predicted phage tail protein